MIAAAAPAPELQHPGIAAIAATALTDVKAVFAAMMPHHAVAAPNRPRVKLAAAVRPARDAGRSHAVVQLGAYASSQRVLAAWTGESHKFAALRPYAPMSARFASPRGTFYRLSVRGFNSVAEAKALCTSLRHAGGACFVRNVEGDAPVNIAMR
jgi:cell division septation protein DedD